MSQTKEDVSGFVAMMAGQSKAQGVTEKIIANGTANVAAPAAQQPPAQQQQQPPAGTEQRITPPAPVQPVAQQQQAAPAAPAQQQEEFIDTPMGKIPVRKQAQAEAPKVESWEQVFTIEDTFKAFGQKFEKPQDFVEKGIKQITEWRSQAAQAAEAKQKYEGLAQAFQALPDELKSVVNAGIEGLKSGDTEAWKKAINAGPSIDFKSPPEKIDKEVLLNTYFSGKFTPDEIADPENKAVQVAIDSARSLYSRDKSEREQLARQKIAEAQQHQEAVSASMNSSIEKLASLLPFQPDEAKVNEVKTKMESGAWINDLKNPDGTWKETAAAGILMASNGPQTLAQVFQFVQNRVTSQNNEQIVARGDMAVVHGNGNGSDKAQLQVKDNQDALKQLMGGKKRHY